MLNITDPRNLPPNFYLISKSGVDFLSELIQWKTGLWNHSMLMRKPDFVVWQGIQIQEKSIELYMKKYVRMDFFTLKEVNVSAIAAMNSYINKRMSGHWWTQTYDFLGIVGQAIGIPAIHTPGLDYCSVFELAVLKAGAPFLPTKSAFVINTQTPESNPQNLHDMYVNNPDVFEYEGCYESDEGVIV